MHHLSIANESVDFVSSSFFKELTLAFVELKAIKKTELVDSEIAGTIAAIIKHHTGLNIVFSIGTDGPAVDIPAVNKNNPLINSFIRNYVSSSDGIKMINEANGIIRGTVNLKTGKVTGIFSEVKSTIYFPTEMIQSSKIDPEEMAAITLHEVGHLFVYYEYMARSVTANQALAGLSKGLDGSGSVEQREAVLISVKKALNLSELDTKALAKTTNNKIAEIVVVSNIAKSIESELGSNVCDFSTWEYLADQFAARHGAGRFLVTGLEKVYRGMWNISFRNSIGFLALEALKASLVIGPFIIAATTGITLSLLLTVGILMMAMDGSGDGTYDVPGARMKRVRNQIVENLKDKKLSKEGIERLKEDLDAIDVVMAEVNDRRQLIEVVWSTLIPSSRKAANQLRLQQELEDIATNDLFIKAAELKVLA